MRYWFVIEGFGFVIWRLLRQFFQVVTPRTEELLDVLLWAMDIALNPTFINLTDSFESWAYRRGLGQQLRRLEERRWVERSESRGGERLYRLTETGRLQALGGRDPEQCWTRPWDGWWRMVIFDIPTRENNARERLRRFLKSRNFGLLQHSVWVTPHSLHEECALLADQNVDTRSLIFLKSRPCAGETNEDIVAGAWNFEHINEKYRDYLHVLESRPRNKLKRKSDVEVLQIWAEQERESWREAVSQDPLLPLALLPKVYLGREVWQRRMGELRKAGKLLSAWQGHRE